jgi:hypothetical protein
MELVGALRDSGETHSRAYDVLAGQMFMRPDEPAPEGEDTQRQAGSEWTLACMPIGHEDSYTRTSQVRGARPMIWPVLRAMSTPLVINGTHRARDAALRNSIVGS